MNKFFFTIGQSMYYDLKIFIISLILVLFIHSQNMQILFPLDKSYHYHHSILVELLAFLIASINVLQNMTVLFVIPQTRCAFNLINVHFFV